MAAPNVVNVSSLYGKTAGLAITTSANDIVTCPANKVCKINLLTVSNVDGTNDATVDVIFYDSGSTTSFYILKTVTVPADATIDVLSKPIYLEESDELRLVASAASDLEGVASYEEIDDA